MQVSRTHPCHGTDEIFGKKTQLVMLDAGNEAASAFPAGHQVSVYHD